MWTLFKKNSDSTAKKSTIVQSSDSLRNFDNSDWKLDDRKWVSKRINAWPDIERMLTNHKKTAKARNIIKAYYLRGEMPDWASLQTWRDDTRHLDLFICLWLHPSSDLAVLKNLRDAYFESEWVVPGDIRFGIEFFLWTLPRLTASHAPMKPATFPTPGDRTELLFDLILGSPPQLKLKLANPDIPVNNREYHVRIPEIGDIDLIGILLAQPRVLNVHESFLYLYENPIEWWYSNCAENEQSFFESYKKGPTTIRNLEIALYRIYHFDIAKEGDTCRTRLALKIRNMLDERKFFETVESVWDLIKADKIRVKDPWAF